MLSTSADFPFCLLPSQIIYSTIRFIDNEAVRDAMEDCIKLKKEFPHLIAGQFLEALKSRRVAGTDSPHFPPQVSISSGTKTPCSLSSTILSRFYGSKSGSRRRDSIFRTSFSEFPASSRLASSLQALTLSLFSFISAGETLGDGDAIDDNLFDAILLVSLRSEVEIHVVALDC